MKKIMIAMSAGDWNGVQHRPHHFMKRASKAGWEVLYLEPPATLLSPLKDKNMLQRWKNWANGPRKIEDNLTVISSPPVLPFGNKYRAINKINQRIISQELKKQLKNYTYSKVDLYSFLPNSVDTLEYIDFDKIIYDCVDDHAAFTGLINEDVVLKMEEELSKSSHALVATAKQLVEDRKNWGEFHLVPNGTEYEHFQPAEKKGNLLCPHDLPDTNKPILGFVGGISDWIDLKSIEEVAKRMPEIQVIMIGPVDTDVENLKKLPNVTFLGPKQYTELPRYIQYFDVCLIPFKINKLTASVNPIKLYEYLSTGKPVVSTPLPEVVVYNDVVHIGNNVEELVQAIRISLTPEENTEEKRNQRQQVAQENSWDSRWEKVMKLING
ncbi:glycosyltransferase [Sutcliffiella sp. NPDC057660]|uniref:glycosyltransferase n=1 Tax=Sutcliffiella sp. NPDC057660 TaxID=3346199 RepID=UPI00369D7CF7